MTRVEHADGAWNDPSNWSTGAVPGPSDDVVIDVPESVTITFSVSDGTVARVDLHEVLRIANGRLTVNGSLANAGTVALEGGTLRGAAIAGGNVTYARGNLDSLTLGTGAVLDPAGAGAVITVLRGLSLDGALIRIGFPPDSSSAVNFSGGSQTLGGTGKVEFVSSNAGNLLRATSGGALTLGPNIVVQAQRLRGPFLWTAAYFLKRKLFFQKNCAIAPQENVLPRKTSKAFSELAGQDFSIISDELQHL